MSGSGRGDRAVPGLPGLRGLRYTAPALLWTCAFFVVPFALMALASVSTRVSGETVLTWSLVLLRQFHG